MDPACSQDQLRVKNDDIQSLSRCKKGICGAFLPTPHVHQCYVMSTHVWADSRFKFMQYACLAIRKPFIWNKQRTSSPDESRSTIDTVYISGFR
ncbi:hypothetical protein PHSY_007130 [Pseudozyma hubeiensis SY62]|uniref:Uncharacterized protein n=1 Tax=Pseudozyma hubeiensis (strain SY62) TaxID=1305764 RepID=R9PDR8_PSEHS|nr:hypothetical protein PHSY_007130 [Pseudozyma hubeiensis SY62]GAC99528.1 hypothetical protein PHSY_007130 [Pseudozyma hubeiensis SY62]